MNLIPPIRGWLELIYYPLTALNGHCFASLATFYIA